MNAPEWVVTQFAVGRIGAVLVNINPAYRLHELEGRLAAGRRGDPDRRRAVQGLEFRGDGRDALPRGRRRRRPRTGPPPSCPALRRLIALGDRPGPGWWTWADLEAAPVRRRGWPSASARPCARRCLQHPVHLGHDRAAQRGDAHPPQRLDERLFTSASACGTRPTIAFACRCRSIIVSAACWARWSARFTARRWSSRPRASTPGARWPRSTSERCTSLYGVPTMFVAELDHPDFARFDLSSLRTGIMAGSPCPLAADGGRC